MNIRVALRHLITLQDEITHLNETRGDIELIRAKQAQRDEVMDGIVDLFGELRDALDVSIRTLERINRSQRRRAEDRKAFNEPRRKYDRTYRS